jgi:putative oxidoreductase
MSETIVTRWKSAQRRVASPDVQQTSRDVALAVVRIALAWIFIYHGAVTLFGAFHGAGLHATATFFATVAHLHPGIFFATLSGIVEFFGGIALALGIFGRLAALGLVGDMVIAMITVTFKNGIVSSAPGSGYELNLALVALAAAIVLLGTGRYGLDYLIRRTLGRSASFV